MNRTHNSEGEIYVYNARGDTVQLVKNNAVVVSYTYDAFGNLTSQTGESDNPFLYCSEYFDEETGTYYLRARYYDPANGRFTQQDAWGYMDTSDPLSLNLYTYCCNNPVMYVDPSGCIVSGWDIANCTKDEIEELKRLTNDWYKAESVGDKAAMDRAHKDAVAIRTKYLSTIETVNEDGHISIKLPQEDVDRGVLVVTINGDQYMDVTTPLNNALAESRQSFFDHSLDFLWFIGQVDNNKNWDIKLQQPWETTIGVTYPGSINKPVVFMEAFVTPENLGNFTYGYLGSYAGYGYLVLFAGRNYAAGKGVPFLEVNV